MAKRKLVYKYRIIDTHGDKKEAERHVKFLNSQVHPFIKKRTGLHYDMKRVVMAKTLGGGTVYRIWAKEHAVE